MKQVKLEEIKDNELLFTQGYEDLTNDFLWLIEQAERVQELERTTSEYLYSSNYLLEQNKRYREALEKILHQHELEEEIPDHDFMWNVQDIARKALESESDE